MFKFKISTAGKTLLLLFCFFVFLNLAVYSEEKTFSLKDCLIYSSDNNPDIKSYSFKVKAYFSKVGQARSGYLPQLTGSASYDRSGSQTTDMVRDNNDSLRLSQLIYDFNKTIYGIQMADEELSQSNLNLYDTTQSVFLNVVKSYCDVLKNNHLVEAMKKNVSRMKETLSQAEAFFLQGTKSKIDVTTAEINLSSVKLELIKAENSLKVSYQALYEAMGFTGESSLSLVEIKELIQYGYSLEDSLAFAFKERPDIKIMASKVKESTMQEKYNKRGAYPSITGDGSYSWDGAQYPLGRSWNIGLNLSWSIFDGGNTIWKVKEAQANTQDYKAQLTSHKNQAKKEVTDYYTTMTEKHDTLMVNKDRFRQAKENLDLADGRYKVGMGNIIELTQAQYEYIKSEADVIASTYEYMKAKADLEKSTGANLASIYAEE
ncbi:MAG: TolC family protein [Armatimonadota bacterium]